MVDDDDDDAYERVRRWGGSHVLLLLLLLLLLLVDDDCLLVFVCIAFNNVLYALLILVNCVAAFCFSVAVDVRVVVISG